jgi:hypothetical protein
MPGPRSPKRAPADDPRPKRVLARPTAASGPNAGASAAKPVSSAAKPASSAVGPMPSVAGGGTPVPERALVLTGMQPRTPDANPGQPTLRWQSRARSVDGIQRELGKIWARPPGSVPAGEDGERHVAARTSVLNLVVSVRRPEIGQRAAATISQLTGRHPSRTMVISSVDPDGPSWLDAQIQAFCVTPRRDAPETCGELIYLTAGGDSGRHLRSLVAPLLIHDLPVTVWVPGEPSFGTVWALELGDMADRLVVDGSHWAGSGIARLTEFAQLADGRLALSDFALMRQSRWREAIAATFDVPELTPFLRSIRRVDVTYATHDELGDPLATNVVKPIYHVAWIAGRLGMHVEAGLAPMVRHAAIDAGDSAGTAAGTPAPTSKPRPARASEPDDEADDLDPLPGPLPGGFDARLRHGSADVTVTLRPRLSGMPAGTTLRVELVASNRGSTLHTTVTAEAETVRCRVRLNGEQVLERRFNSPRRVDGDLLAEAIERTSDDRYERETIRMAGHMVDPKSAPVLTPSRTQGGSQ